MSTETVNAVIVICLVVAMVIGTLTLIWFFLSLFMAPSAQGKKPKSIIMVGGPQNAGTQNRNRTPGRSLGKALAQTARPKGRKPAGIAGNGHVQVRSSPWPPNRGVLGHRG